MAFLIRSTLVYAVPLMLVALAGVYAERSGIINLALEGIMIFGAFMGVLFVRSVQQFGWFAEAYAEKHYLSLQGFALLAMLFSALSGAIFSTLLAFAAINLKADQTIGGTALNLLAPAFVLFFIRIIANQNTMNMLEGDSASWFMLKKGMFGYGKKDNMSFLGSAFVDKVYVATYICILVFVIMAVILYKTRFGMRLRSCGENPQAADSLGINVVRMRYSGTIIYGALAGILLLGESIRRLCCARLFPAVSDALSESAAAQVVTAPITLRLFGCLTPVGIIASVVVSPLVTYFLYAGLVGIVICLALPFLSPVFGGILNVLYGLIRGIVVFFARFPAVTI